MKIAYITRLYVAVSINLGILLLPSSFAMNDQSHHRSPPKILSHHAQARPIWNNEEIKIFLLDIAQKFHDDNSILIIKKNREDYLKMIEKLKNMKSEESKETMKYFKENLDVPNIILGGLYLNVKKLSESEKNILTRQINVTLPKSTIEETYNRFHIIPLRPLKKEKLILSCGNYPTSLRFSDEVASSHSHDDADTVDSDIKMNPTVVADLSFNGFFQYLVENKKVYKEIIGEAGYRLHGHNGVQKLKLILEKGGVYEDQKALLNLTIINEERINNFPIEMVGDDKSLKIILSKNEFDQLSKMNPAELRKKLIDEAQKYYISQGFKIDLSNQLSSFLKEQLFDKDIYCAYNARFDIKLIRLS